MQLQIYKKWLYQELLFQLVLYRQQVELFIGIWRPSPSKITFNFQGTRVTHFTDLLKFILMTFIYIFYY